MGTSTHLSIILTKFLACSGSDSKFDTVEISLSQPSISTYSTSSGFSVKLFTLE
ncbi:adenylosuccinate synthetase [Megavirus courdo7]|uniref:Adenylosuccinate synthetase n=1 Tax=Megavirus courdo7 TaxID=1128135 RepID=H2ECP1_9VIRU|nr:adenylosuccinate synthetase [Megavirus courdo7]